MGLMDSTVVVLEPYVNWATLVAKILVAAITVVGIFIAFQAIVYWVCISFRGGGETIGLGFHQKRC